MILINADHVNVAFNRPAFQSSTWSPAICNNETLMATKNWKDRFQKQRCRKFSADKAVDGLPIRHPEEWMDIRNISSYSLRFHGENGPNWAFPFNTYFPMGFGVNHSAWGSNIKLERYPANMHFMVTNCMATTKIEPNAWWAVDLGMNMLLKYVDILNTNCDWDSDGYWWDCRSVHYKDCPNCK